MIKFIPHKYFVKYLILIGLFMMINYNKSYAAQQLPKRGELTIVAWWGIPRNELTLNRFIELKAAGFNVTFNNMATLDDLKRALFLGRLSGVKIIATNRDIVNADLNSIRQIRDSTSLLAYSLGDEPNASQFNELKSKVVQIKNADKNHPCYINLLPDASREMLGTDFPNYLHRAIFELQLSFLSFDIYPITTKGINGGWYDNLEKAAEAARNSNIPMWTFVLSTPHSTPGTTYATPSINSLRLQVYSNLAYGSQAIQYFTYWLPESKEYNYHDAPITAGKKTKTYNLVKKMNQEIQAISGVFKDGYVEDVAHIGVQPKGTRMLMRQPDGMEITKRTSGSHLLISQIRHKDAKYVVLQNCDLNKSVNLILNLSKGMMQVLKNGTLKNAEGSKRYQILPGDILIFDNTNASIFNTSAKNMIRPQNLVANITSFFMLFILVNILLSFYILNRQGRYSK